MTALGQSLPQNRNHINDLGRIRDLACERAVALIPDLAVQAGFRRIKGRHNQLGCIHGEDRTPSAHVYHWGVKCFSCDGRWTPIDLVMLRDNSTFVEALKALADETFVPWPDSSAEERAKYRAAKAAAPDLARQMEDWARGLYLWAEQRKHDLVACLHWAWEVENEPLAEHFGNEIGKLGTALSIKNARPQVIAEAYANLVRTQPGRVKALREAGRADREHAEAVTTGIVHMLTVTQLEPSEAVN